MSDVNSVTLQGRLTVPPELRKTPSGVAVCDLRLASNRHVRKSDGSGYDQHTIFMKVTLWNQQAEKFAKRLKVGDEVLVQGQLFDDNFEREEGGRTSGRFKVDNVHIQLLRESSSKDAPETTESAPVV